MAASSERALSGFTRSEVALTQSVVRWWGGLCDCDDKNDVRDKRGRSGGVVPRHERVDF